MTYDELVEKVAREIVKSRGRDPEECVFGSGSKIHGFTCHQKTWEREVVAAEAVISTIRDALMEPTEKMRSAAEEADWEADYDITFSDCWRAMLAASPLGEKK